jgi:hypothetical protein
MALPMPVGDNISELTDWLELRISATDTAGIPLSKLDRLLKAEGSELADEELDPAELDDGLEVTQSAAGAAAAEADVRVELIRQEVTERAAVGARVYPFIVDGERVQPHDVCGSDVYRLLLVLGSPDLPYRSERRAHEVEEAFDYIAMAALRRFLGRPATMGVRFARTARHNDAEIDAASPDPLRRPTGFVDAIEWLRRWLQAGQGVRSAEIEPELLTHWEDEGEDEPPPLGREPLSSYNDAGVDVVVWWRFADGRRGFPVLLAQCTLQLSWESKLHDIDIDQWRAWIDFDTVPPQRALVIPFADRRDHPLWPDRTLRAGVIVDRVRLLELLDEIECDELAALIDDRVRAWTQTELRAA